MWNALVKFVIYGFFISTITAAGTLLGTLIACAIGVYLNLTATSLAPVIIQLVFIALSFIFSLFIGSFFYRLYQRINALFDYYTQN